MTTGDALSTPVAMARALACGIGLGLVGAAGWAIAVHYTPLQIGFIAWGIGWLAGKGVRLGNGGRCSLAWGVTAAAIAVGCFAVSKLFSILLRVSEGNQILDWIAVYRDEYSIFDVLWIAFAIWPAYCIGVRGRDY